MDRMDRNSMQMLALSAGRAGQVIIGDEFFAYNTARTTVGVAGAATVNIAVEANSDFMVEKMTYLADIALATQTDSSRVVPLVTAQINATGSGRNMFNIDAPIPCVFGTGQTPFILPRAYLIPASSTIQITFTNFSAATAYNITLVFAGRKIFWGQQRPGFELTRQR